MKKILLLVFIAMAIVSCKNDEKKEATTETTEELSKETVMTGSFMYFEDAAVFQTRNELFGVIQNEKMEELIIQSQPLKTEPTDEVVTTLKVKTSKKQENEEGWDNRIEILEIIKVSKSNPDDNNIIKLGKEKNAENQ